jgi:hypothetical protein
MDIERFLFYAFFRFEVCLRKQEVIDAGFCLWLILEVWFFAIKSVNLLIDWLLAFLINPWVVILVKELMLSQVVSRI